MEVKEAIKHLKESAKVNFDEGFYEYHDKEKEIIALLKSLQAENKALKKERDAYKGMWEEFKRKYNEDFNLIDIGYMDINYATQIDLESAINVLENKYLGGGE